MARQDLPEQMDKKNARGKAKGQGKRTQASDPLQTSILHWLYIIALIQAFNREGGAVRVGFTRDGGAWALGVYLGEDYGTEYIRATEDFDTAVAEIAYMWLADKGSFYRETVDTTYDSIRALQVPQKTAPKS